MSEHRKYVITLKLHDEERWSIRAVPRESVGLPYLQEAVGGNVDVFTFTFENEDQPYDVWVHDEGMFEYADQPNLALSMLRGYQMFGPALICDSDGFGASVPMTHERTQQMLESLNGILSGLGLVESEMRGQR